MEAGGYSTGSTRLLATGTKIEAVATLDVTVVAIDVIIISISTTENSESARIP